MSPRSIFALVWAGGLLLAGSASAQEVAGQETAPRESAPRESVTRHTVDVGGETLRYTAIAGEIVLEDAATTFFGVEHTFDHSSIDPDRITLENYQGGHMMYLVETSLAELSADIRAFIAGR